ncbi:GNAT family N-acetyltransferase [bacterium]|nr:GNAT family N-acetyltransferase [bacterium]
MKKKYSRKADKSEFDPIFMMGFDAWAEGSESDYLNTCRTSPKYAHGDWYVLENENGAIISSLIVYKFGSGEYGIGSIATVKNLRRQGNASKLISDVLEQIEKESPKATLFLYSDIIPDFYERFGFVQLPLTAQRYKTTTCMVRGKDTKKFLAPETTPEYF